MIKIQLEKRHIPEEEFNKLGFLLDADSNGNVQENKTTVINLFCLRAICITHKALTRERNKIIEEIALKKTRVASQKADNVRKIYKENTKTKNLI